MINLPLYISAEVISRIFYIPFFLFFVFITSLYYIFRYSHTRDYNNICARNWTLVFGVSRPLSQNADNDRLSRYYYHYIIIILYSTRATYLLQHAYYHYLLYLLLYSTHVPTYPLHVYSILYRYRYIYLYIVGILYCIGVCIMYGFVQ